jgi:UDP-N-acetylmuramate dehydrogenase
MTIQENVSLAKYTTFKIGGPAKFFCLVSNEKELVEAVNFAKTKNLPIFVIGGGSNLLVSDSGYSGLVIKLNILGINYDGDKVTAFAGEDWDNFVADTVEHGFHGLENLSAIPGTVGAAPVQNIGAYGVDVANTIEEVRVLDIDSGKFITLKNSECGFEYRDSIFKHQKGKHIVVSVVFKLEKNGKVDISYKDLVDYFAGKGIINPTIKEVRDAVVIIRKSKLPDWSVWGTAGSFFKNPVISVQEYVDLKQKFSDIPSFPQCDGKIKVSLAWILDNVCHAKGLAVGNAKVYENQALVLIAKPGASASEVVELSRKIQDLVKEKTGLVIEAEVEWVN